MAGWPIPYGTGRALRPIAWPAADRSVGRTLTLLGLGLCALCAAEHPHSDDPAPPLPPTPAVTPLTPGTAARTAEANDDLDHRIDALIAEHDRRIAELLHAGISPNPVADRTPRLAERHDPATDEVLRTHAEARAKLRQALEKAAARSSRASTDPLERAQARIQAAQVMPLLANNRLAIAECYKELAGGPGGTAEDVQAGLTAIAGIDPVQIRDEERPRLLYLGLWLQLEALRKAPATTTPAQREQMLGEARRRQTELTAQFPTSVLAQTSEALFAGIVAPAAQAAAP